MDKITSRRNPLCIHMKNLGASRSYREERREFLCDGLKLLEEAIISGAGVTNVLTSSHLPFPLPVDARVYFTDRSIIDSISSLKNAQNTLFTVKMPPPGGFAHGSCINLLLDGVQDPGNVGTIIRTAYAFGMGGVILTGDCADLYNPKTVRATMGAVFKQRVIAMTAEEIAALSLSGVRFIGTIPGERGTGSANGDIVPGKVHADFSNVIKNLNRDNNEHPPNEAVIAIGSEGRGLSAEVLALCAERISIPVSPGCESLNAAIAAAIIMWESYKCLH